MSIFPNKKTLVLSISIILLVIAATVTVFIVRRGDSVIPKSIEEQISYPIFYPNSSVITVNRQTITYTPAYHLLYFKGYSVGSSHVELVISEEPTPGSFNDIPNYYTAYINDLNEYDDFNNINGQTYLTMPKDLGGDQSAVMNTKGTLMFIRAYGKLSTYQWETIFNGLSVIAR